MNTTLAADEVRWRDEFHQYHNTIWVAYDSNPPPRLYHYSRIENIESILESREIRFSDVRRMKQDEEDGVYWLEVFRPIIKQNPHVPERVKNAFAYSDDFGLGEHWNLYAACFSAHDNLAHQWENFAGDESGCAIEIAFEALPAVRDGGKSHGISRLLYDRTEQQRKANQLVSVAVERACRVPQANRDKYWELCATFEFLVCGQRFKKSSCSKEDEWRLAIVEIDTADLHKPLPLTPDLVTGVVKGRKCVTSDEEIKNWLEQGGYPGVVRQCPMPLL